MNTKPRSGCSQIKGVRRTFVVAGVFLLVMAKRWVLLVQPFHISPIRVQMNAILKRAFHFFLYSFNSINSQCEPLPNAKWHWRLLKLVNNVPYFLILRRNCWHLPQLQGFSNWRFDRLFCQFKIVQSLGHFRLNQVMHFNYIIYNVFLYLDQWMIDRWWLL